MHAHPRPHGCAGAVRLPDRGDTRLLRDCYRSRRRYASRSSGSATIPTSRPTSCARSGGSAAHSAYTSKCSAGDCCPHIRHRSTRRRSTRHRSTRHRSTRFRRFHPLPPRAGSCRSRRSSGTSIFTAKSQLSSCAPARRRCSAPARCFIPLHAPHAAPFHASCAS